MKIFGIGTDIVKTSRLKKILSNKLIINRIFHIKEIQRCNKIYKFHNCFAKRFAAKEAIRKATSTPHHPSKLTFKSIEIFNYASGKPGVDLNNDSVVDISISHDGNYAVAFCVVQ